MTSSRGSGTMAALSALGACAYYASTKVLKYYHYTFEPVHTDVERHLDEERQGLTLVHFSAQLEPCLTQENTLHTRNTPRTTP